MHYIKSASFGGKFTLLRESIISGTETKQEWESKMLRSVDKTMSSGSSSSSSSSWAAKGSYGLFGLGGKFDTSGNKQKGNTEATNEQESTKEEESASTSDAAREETQMTRDEIIVEGGHQQVAAILSDKNRAGFKAEFKDWLDSIPDYPKGYDFKFGQLTELLDMNFRQLLESMGDIKACWEKNVTNGYYEETIKDEKGDITKVKRKCQFEHSNDFVEQMNKRRLSLKRAIAVYADNKGGTGTDLTLPAGHSSCEGKRSEEKKEIDYKTLTNGKSYLVEFNLQSPIGTKISTDDRFLISFQQKEGSNSGRWMVSSGQEPVAGQMSKIMTKSEQTRTVRIKDVDFTLVTDSSATTLEWSQENCERNAERFEIGGTNISCSEKAKDSVDWLDTPLAVVKSFQTPDSFLPCNVKWSNLHMLMNDNSCVRFTAASAGPIYFVLSAIPASFDTWYYFRITNVSHHLVTLNFDICIGYTVYPNAKHGISTFTGEYLVAFITFMF